MTSAVSDVLAAANERDAIEAQIRDAHEALATYGSVGLHEPLVDAQGFPRADVDVHQVRILRNRIQRTSPARGAQRKRPRLIRARCRPSRPPPGTDLRNDHRDVMKRIEDGLHRVHSAGGATVAAPAAVAGPGPAVTSRMPSTTPAGAAVNGTTPQAPAAAPTVRTWRTRMPGDSACRWWPGGCRRSPPTIAIRG